MKKSKQPSKMALISYVGMFIFSKPQCSEMCLQLKLIARNDITVDVHELIMFI